MAFHHMGSVLKANTISQSVATLPVSGSCGSVPGRDWNHFIQSAEPGAGEQIYESPGFPPGQVLYGGS